MNSVGDVGSLSYHVKNSVALTGATEFRYYLLLHLSRQILQELIQQLLIAVLHDDDMSQLAAEESRVNMTVDCHRLYLFQHIIESRLIVNAPLEGGGY